MKFLDFCVQYEVLPHLVLLIDGLLCSTMGSRCWKGVHYTLVCFESLLFTTVQDYSRVLFMITLKAARICCTDLVSRALRTLTGSCLLQLVFESTTLPTSPAAMKYPAHKPLYVP